jgi:hypothetical protein
MASQEKEKIIKYIALIGSILILALGVYLWLNSFDGYYGTRDFNSYDLIWIAFLVTQLCSAIVAKKSLKTTNPEIELVAKRNKLLKLQVEQKELEDKLK